MTRRRVALAMAVLLGWAPLAHAQPDTPRETPPLTLAEVLAAVDRTHPAFDVADAAVDRARGKALSARGAFDPGVTIRGQWDPVGYYQTGQVDAALRQATPLWGVGLYAGYRLGLGSYPVYKGEVQTLSGGEVRAGLDVPIWKDGPIDKRRAEIRRTKLGRSAADCDVDTTALSIRQQAAAAYWRWVATGQEVRVQEDLLAVAEQRAGALTEQASAGSIARILVTDNTRLVLDRRSKLVAAHQEFAAANLRLSLFLRDENLNPVRSEISRVPPQIADELDEPTPHPDRDVAAALDRRPELCRLRLDKQAAEVSVRLAKNQRAPAINAFGYVSRDFGTGPAELRPTALGVGVAVEIPLALRTARGELQAARADARALDARLRATRDAITAEVRTALVNLRATADQIELARQQVEAATALADAEREKFDAGASDLVVVNLRELAVAEAARAEIEARATHQQALADYRTATGAGL